MKLFHCVVVMGAAMGGGCGVEEDARTATSADADGSNDATALGTAGNDASVIIDPACTGVSVCAQPQQYQCDGATCVCDPSSPLSPADCPQTAQFECTNFASNCGCRCNLEAGTDPLACCGDAGMEAGAPCSNYNTYLQWSCHSYDPPVGCDCRRLVVGIL
jgi:hypothetical protein